VWRKGCLLNPIAYPSALDPSSPSRNFDTTDGRFYLYYTRFNREAGTDLDRDLVRVPVTITGTGIRRLAVPAR
jgi:hypothetical protein